VKHIGVREFRDNASAFLAGSEPVAIERHGHLLGFFIPVKPDPTERQRALKRLEKSVQSVIAEGHLSEDDLAKLIDISTDEENEAAID